MHLTGFIVDAVMLDHLAELGHQLFVKFIFKEAAEVVLLLFEESLLKQSLGFTKRLTKINQIELRPNIFNIFTKWCAGQPDAILTFSADGTTHAVGQGLQVAALVDFISYKRVKTSEHFSSTLGVYRLLAFFAFTGTGVFFSQHSHC